MRVNVISFTPIEKCSHPCTDFHETDKCPTAICADLTKFHLNWKINVEIVGGNSFKPIRNVALSVLIFMKFTYA